jgi:hypothetical protein
MKSSDIDTMILEKGNPCISIVIPTPRYAKGQIQNSELIERSLLRAKKLAAYSAWPQEKINQLQAKLNSLLTGIDYMRLEESIAIFISPNVSRIFLLPFPVKEKVMLSNSFEMRDLFYLSQYLSTYFLITLSKKRVRLFKGAGRQLLEIINDDFPQLYKEEYEYARPSIASGSSTGLKGFERDKSIVQEIRTRAFFRRADETLNKYLKADTPLFVAGVGEEVADFEQISHHVKNVSSKIPGNYDIDAVHPLAEFAWKSTQEVVKSSHKQLLSKLNEDIGKQLAVDGIRDVWKAAREGNGLTLVLEKDYQVMAYYSPVNDSHLFLEPPLPPYEIILDAADDVIQIVKEKGGKIVIVENGELKHLGRIALLLRYPRP